MSNNKDSKAFRLSNEEKEVLPTPPSEDLFLSKIDTFNQYQTNNRALSDLTHNDDFQQKAESFTPQNFRDFNCKYSAEDYNLHQKEFNNLFHHQSILPPKDTSTSTKLETSSLVATKLLENHDKKLSPVSKESNVSYDELLKRMDYLQQKLDYNQSILDYNQTVIGYNQFRFFDNYQNSLSNCPDVCSNIQDKPTSYLNFQDDRNNSVHLTESRTLFSMMNTAGTSPNNNVYDEYDQFKKETFELFSNSYQN